MHSTSLVAASLAGAFDLVPIAYDPASHPDSWYSKLVAPGHLPARYNLTGMFTGNVTGSRKCDAYVWAIDELITSGACNACVHGYMIDAFWTTVADKADRLANTIPNQDYVISQRGFFWDLDVWQDQAPNDDPTQPLGTDYNTLVAILTASNKAMVCVCVCSPLTLKHLCMLQSRTSVILSHTQTHTHTHTHTHMDQRRWLVTREGA